MSANRPLPLGDRRRTERQAAAKIIGGTMAAQNRAGDQPARADHMNEVVDRSAPRWAWDAIDCAFEGGNSFNMDKDGDDQAKVDAAVEAMMNACEHPELDWIATPDSDD